ncbi:hypothetical protein AAMO2058_000113000 [Amorphochlora amoebiformis]|uniref:Major facilitator superfamily (MFS) profile domain-containing protein n=1 Tax=Amorphochlora amoebiformis TaxID=1561963 RepID=A0A7S0H4G1_9EUKA|mmetsp:Transcript_34910/g.56326  ORF Transcript_34910/g.56326 Transcript_34910/m.56326 type:complete len:470 (+) Transcript_34910:59-1468(+)
MASLGENEVKDDVNEPFIPNQEHKDHLNPIKVSFSNGYWKESWEFTKNNWIPLLANAFEWFEFATFAYQVEAISQNFSNGNESVVWVIFSVAFLCRPIGGILVGYLGDFFGRKLAFRLASITVVLSTFLQGTLPSQLAGGDIGRQSGLVLLLILRVMQGLGIGGEVGSGIILLAESAKRQHVGITLGWLTVSSGVGFMFASLSAALINSIMSEEDVVAYGWRLPFLLSIIPGVLLLRVLERLEETQEFSQLSDIRREQSSIFNPDIMKRISTYVLCQGGVASFWYIGCIYVFDWLKDTKNSESDGFGAAELLWIATFQNSIQLPSALFFGVCLDIFGLRTMFPFLTASILVFVLPVFVLLDTIGPNLILILFGPGIIFGILSGGLGSASALLAVDLFPVEYRHRSVGLSYNLSVMLFGGLGPAWAELAEGHIPVAPGVLIGISAAISFLTFVFLAQNLIPLAKKPHVNP